MDNNLLNGLTLALTSGALTATGAATTYDTTAAINFAIRGVHGSKAAVSAGATPTTDYATGLPITLMANQGRTVVWTLLADGSVKVLAGPVVPCLGGAFPAPPQFPAVPDEAAPFAYQVLKAGSTAVGTVGFGSTNWNATGFTNSVKNVLNLPDRPQSA